MPDVEPPEDYRGTPRQVLLRAGTRLTRIHETQFAPVAFNPTPVESLWRGGRFDATPSDAFPYLYAAGSDGCAVSESLLRDLAIDAQGNRRLWEATLAGRRISWLDTTADLTLVSPISGEDLAAIGQDNWLTTCDGGLYSKTRYWGRAIRAWAPWAQGFAWRSNREPNDIAYVFFGDRCPPGIFAEARHHRYRAPWGNRLDTGAGHGYLLEILTRYNVTLSAAEP